MNTTASCASNFSSIYEIVQQADKGSINVTILAQTYPCVCTLAWGTGNPDLSGIGVSKFSSHIPSPHVPLINILGKHILHLPTNPHHLFRPNLHIHLWLPPSKNQRSASRTNSAPPRYRRIHPQPSVNIRRLQWSVQHHSSHSQRRPSPPISSIL